MYCPVCKSKETKVLDSRVTEDGMVVRRRRECILCNYRFSTNEEIELLDITVVKNNGDRQSYDRSKLESGILRSLVKRPYTKENFHHLIHSIERDIQKQKKREITSQTIGELVMKWLMKFDTVAYIRFASIYRAFADVKTFEKEIKSLRENKKHTIKNT